MKTASSRDSVSEEQSVAADLARGMFGLAWHTIRLPILAFLTILEPIVRVVLSGAAVLGILTAFLFEFAGPAGDFPFWAIVLISLGCQLSLFLYYGLIRLLS